MVWCVLAGVGGHDSMPGVLGEGILSPASAFCSALIIQKRLPRHHGNVLLKLLQGHSTFTSLTPSGIKRNHSAHFSMSNGAESSPN